MKKVAKCAGLLFLILMLGGACLMGMWKWAHRDLVTTVEQLAPGTPLEEVTQRLGTPTDVFASEEDIRWWTGKIGLDVSMEMAGISELHVFMHEGPPFSHILVFVDRHTRKVLLATWRPM